MSNIHPSAIIADTAKIGENVTVGPFAIVSDHTEIGDNCVIESHAVIKPYVKMGANNTVGNHAVIGGNPQDINFDTQTETWVHIGQGNTFGEYVTIHRATQTAKPTAIGDHCFLMAYAHIAHDCQVGSRVIMANVATLGGFAEVGDGVFIGGGTMVHQNTRIGSMAMLGGVLPITRDVMPCALVGEHPPRQRRINAIGLQRAGLTQEKIDVIETVFKLIARGESIEAYASIPEIAQLKTWLDAGKRPLMKFAEGI